MGSFWENAKALFVYRDLRNKILFTLFLLILVRILAHIPLPGVDISALREFFERNQLFGLLNMFSGGTMANFSIVLMGVGPYITASIVMQLLTKVIPQLEALLEVFSSQSSHTDYLRIPQAPKLSLLFHYYWS